MKKIATKVVVGTLVGGMLMGAMPATPAHARSNSSRNVLIAVAVIGVGYYFYKQNQDKHQNPTHMTAVPGTSHYFAGNIRHKSAARAS